jgi:hypothetical protein
MRVHFQLWYQLADINEIWCQGYDIEIHHNVHFPISVHPRDIGDDFILCHCDMITDIVFWYALQTSESRVRGLSAQKYYHL